MRGLKEIDSIQCIIRLLCGLMSCTIGGGFLSEEITSSVVNTSMLTLIITDMVKSEILNIFYRRNRLP